MLRAIWVLAAVCVLAPAPARASGLPPLAGSTTVTSESPAWMDVDVPRPLPILAGSGLNGARFGLHGEGEAHTLVLRGLDRLPDGRRAELQLIHLGRPGEDAVFIIVTNAVDDAVPAGRYRLYHLSNRPGRATLTFPWLDGETTLRPGRPATFDGGYLPPRPPLVPETSVFGRSGVLSAAGSFYMFAYADRAERAIDRLEGCLYLPGSEPGEDAHQPTCPGGVSSDGTPYLTEQGRGLIHVGLSDFPAGSYGLGGNFQEVGLVPLRCSRSGPCGGTVAVSGGRPVPYRLRAGATGRVRVRVGSRVAARVRRGRAVRTRLTLVIDMGDQTQQLRLPVTLARR